MTSGTIQYQDSSPPVESVVPYANRNVGGAYPTGIAATVDFSTQAWSVTPQAPYQENARYAPLHETLDPPQVQMDTVPNEGALDISVPERLRRLAGRYVSNPDSTVNGVHLKSGPSGRFQVVITVDIAAQRGQLNVRPHDRDGIQVALRALLVKQLQQLPHNWGGYQDWREWDPKPANGVGRDKHASHTPISPV
ncbi:hypothetical protein F5888DRAFT_1635440 [Russula emetica]|nr:hypothetical protein F5888DRAFT_1635440 [Russula emetica]